MRQLFDLLQGHFERRDGVCDQTLGRRKTSEMIKETLCRANVFLRGSPQRRTSGGVLAGGLPSEVLDEALDGEGLTDSLELLSGSVAPLPFTWEHRQPSFERQLEVPGIATGGQPRYIYLKLFSLLLSPRFTFKCTSKVYLTPQTSIEQFFTHTDPAGFQKQFVPDPSHPSQPFNKHLLCNNTWNM